MTEKAFLREKFDPEREFVVARRFLFNGITLAPGEVFNKSLVVPRKLRLLYDQRYVRMTAAKPGEPASKPQGRERRRLRESAGAA
jgi:hypothetical protein